MDIERAIKFPLDDKDWLKKLLIGGVLNIIPIINMATFGYTLQAGKNIIDGQEAPLPEWSEFGSYFVKGLMAFVAILIYSLPIIAVSCLSGILDGALASSGGYPRTTMAVVALCFGIFGSIYGLLVQFVAPAALTQYMLTDEFGVFFRFGDIWAYIRANIGDYVVAFLLLIVISVVASLLGTIACVVGLVLTLPWAFLSMAHLYAQVYRQSDQAQTA